MGKWSGEIIFKKKNCNVICKYYRKGSEASAIVRRQITLRQYLLRNLHLFPHKEICIYNPDNFKVLGSYKDMKCRRKMEMGE